jgi:transglutaminase-like putative cysteine protease
MANRLFSARPIVDPENSLLLRVLIQLMVSIGIVATDVAAETQMSLWAIPLSMVGAAWSWRHRQRPQVGIKFALAAALLVALFHFFQSLLGNLNDTRMVLAELLVMVQAIHTFDMPRRKDLGYSIIIGVILISVAATIGQTMALAPMLLLFLALALPVMVLDYRSRLKLPVLAVERQTFQGQTATLPLKSLSKLLATALALGLVVFAIMPRLPSHQIQSMPMSSDLPVSGSFDPKKIVNPGYQSRPGAKQNGKVGKDIKQKPNQSAGDAANADSEAVDDSSYYGFNQSINQNFRQNSQGEMKPQLVMRVRSQAPGFWRVLGFDRYTGQGWVISKNDKARTLRRPGWASKFILPTKTYPNSRKIVQSYTTVTEFPNLLPALTVPADVYFPTKELALDREGSLRSPGGLVPNFTYTVISQVSERNAELLTKTNNDYRELREVEDYLQIPAALAARLQPFTEKLVAEYPQHQVSREATPLDNSYDKVLYLAQHLKQNYQVPTDLNRLPPMPAEADLAEWFLFHCEDVKDKSMKGECVAGGHPDQFATTYTLMLRSIGIPARLVVGFDQGYFNPFTGMYEVKNTDAHALTEVYFPQYGWYAFDPIPGHPILPPSVEDSQVFGIVKQLWDWVAGLLPLPITAWLGWFFGSILAVLVIIWAFCTQGWFGAICGLAGLILLSFGLWVLVTAWQKWHYGRWLRRQPPMEQVYQQMLGLLQGRELPGRLAHQTPLEHWQGLDGVIREIIAPIVLAYVAWRYGSEPQNVEYLRSILISLKTKK